MMKRFVGIVVGLALVLVAAVLIVPTLFSREELVGKAEAEASDMLGRKVDIGAVTGVQIFPPRLTIEDLQVANAEGFEGPYLARVGEARLGVAFWPLLSGRVEIERFVLDGPDINLESREDGTNNYTLGDAEAPGEERNGEAASFEKAPVVGTIEIAGGRVAYRTPAASYEATGVDAELVLPEIGDPLTLDAAMMVEDIETAIDLAVAEPWGLASGQPSGMSVELDLGGNSFAGDVTATPEPFSLAGPLAVGLTDLSALVPFIGEEAVAAAEPFGEIAVSGNAAVTEDRIGFDGAEFSTALVSGGGNLALGLDGRRPALSGTIRTGRADMRPFFPEPLQEAGETEESEGFPAWSTEEMDFSGLESVDADVTMTAQEIVLPTYTLSNVEAKAVLVDGLLTTTLENAATLGGTAEGSLVVNARSGAPAVASDLTFADVAFAEAGPALFGTSRLFGSGTVRFDLETQGRSQKAWVDNLSGTATADVSDGRILGIDLSALAAAAIRTVDNLKNRQDLLQSLTGAFDETARQSLRPGAETRFDVADFDVTIASGRTRFGEAKLVSDTFRATFGGGVNLASQEIDMRILLAAKAPEASGYREFRAPVAVAGTFSDPDIAIDPSPIVRELARGQATDLLGKAGVEVKEGQKVEDALRERARSELRNLLGGGRKTEEPAKEGEDGGGRR